MYLGDIKVLQVVENNDYCAHLWHYNKIFLSLAFINCTLLESSFHSELNTVIFNYEH